MDQNYNSQCNLNAKDSLLQEYANWISSKKDIRIWLENCTADDINVSLAFTTKVGKPFTLLCPLSYPNHDGIFFVKAEKDMLDWSDTVNEYLEKSSDEKTLTFALDYAETFYDIYFNENIQNTLQTHINNTSMTSSISVNSLSTSKPIECNSKGEKRLLEDFEDWSKKNGSFFTLQKKFKSHDGSINLDINTPGKDFFTLTCPDEYPISDGSNFLVSSNSLELWAQSMNEYLFTEYTNDSLAPALDYAKDLYSIYYDGSDIHSKQESTGSTEVLDKLKNELQTIAYSNVKGIDAKIIENDVGRWSVLLSRFSPLSILNHDLAKLKDKFNYNYIQLELSMNTSVYPYYPPVLKIVRPRLQNHGSLSILKSDILKISQWNADTTLLSVLQQIKNVFEKHARIDLECERNDFNKYPEGAYSEIENHLFRLASVSEVQCRCDMDIQDNIPNSPTQMKLTPVSPHLGTGHKIGNVFKSRTESIGKISKGTGYSIWDVSSSVAPKQDIMIYLLRDEQLGLILNDIVQHLKHKRNVKSPNVSNYLNIDYYKLLESSCLIPFLESELRAFTFLEIEKHFIIYNCIIDVICEIAAHPYLVPLLWQLPCQKESIYNLIRTVETKADVLLKNTQKSSQTSGGKTKKIKLAHEYKNSNQDKFSNEEELANNICRMSKIVTKSLTDENILQCKDPENQKNTCKPPENLERLSETYITHLKKLQYGECDIRVSGNGAHSFGSEFKNSSFVNPKFIKRVSMDLGELSTSLPLSIQSSIFVRTDDSKLPLLRALIIGPEGTPYSGGCFLFDIYCPPDYPSVPPKVRFLTTGGGKIRFNPNLYSCGKVCLSLLGTWSGEQWNKDNSTLLQVLVSIQSLIFVPDPYFNEPGFQSQTGTPTGNAASQTYNNNIILHTMQYAMIDQILYPSQGFEEVIHTHFRIKGNQILEMLASCQFAKTFKPIADRLKKLRCAIENIKL